MKRQLVIGSIPDCDPQIGTILWMLEDTRRRTLQLLAGLDSDALDWTGGPHQHSIGTLLYHIAAIEMSWLFEEVAGEEAPARAWDYFPFDVRDGQGRLTMVKALTMEDHLERLQHTRTLLLQVYKLMTPDDFRKARHFDDYDVTPEWVLHHLMQHEAGHREEISLLNDMLRLI